MIEQKTAKCHTKPQNTKQTVFLKNKGAKRQSHQIEMYCLHQVRHMSIEKLSANEIKIKNRQLIYQYIRSKHHVSKQDIVIALQLSLPTVTQNLDYLKKQGLVDTSHKITNTGGRNATAFSYVKDAKVAIGMYLTANHVSAVAINMSGEIINIVRERVKFNLDSDEYLKKLGEMIETVKEKAKIGDNLLGVGIALPGIISSEGDQVVYGLTLNFTGKKLQEIAKYIPYKCRLFHDSNVTGCMEAWVNKELKNGFYISINNSIGGSLIVNGAVYEGNTKKGGEIGHMTIVPTGGERCYCGKSGCFDTVCSTQVLTKHSDGNLEEFFYLLKSGNDKIQKVWEQYLDYLAMAIHNVRMLIDGTIIIGGYLGEYIGDYIEELYTRVDQRNPFGDKAKDYLIECKYKKEAVASGAGIYFIEEFIKGI